MALERLDDVIGLPGTPHPHPGAVASPILKPMLGTKYTEEILMTLAKDLRGGLAEALPWKDMKPI